MKGKIIIDFDGVSPLIAINRVAKVIKGGQVSCNSSGVFHYCWATRFIDGVSVFTRIKKKGQTSDSFRVHGKSKEQK